MNTKQPVPPPDECIAKPSAPPPPRPAHFDTTWKELARGWKALAQQRGEMIEDLCARVRDMEAQNRHLQGRVNLAVESYGLPRDGVTEVHYS